MRNTTGKPPRAAGLALLAALLWQGAAAETVYKCVENGKTRFSAAPPAAAGGCQPLELQSTPPEAEAEARDKRARLQEEARDQDARIRELIRNDPDIARRAQRAKIAESLARQPVPVPSFGGRRGKKGDGGYK